MINTRGLSTDKTNTLFRVVDIMVKGKVYQNHITNWLAIED